MNIFCMTHEYFQKLIALHRYAVLTTYINTNEAKHVAVPDRNQILFMI